MIHSKPLPQTGIYILTNNGEVVYVGMSSVSIYGRLGSHEGVFPFDDCFIYSFDEIKPDDTRNWATLRGAERMLINLFLPRYNTQHVPLELVKTDYKDRLRSVVNEFLTIAKGDIAILDDDDRFVKRSMVSSYIRSLHNAVEASSRVGEEIYVANQLLDIVTMINHCPYAFQSISLKG